MKLKVFRKKYDKKVKKKNSDSKWILLITVVSFVISFLLSLVSELIIPKANIFISVFLVLFFIFLGVIFDIIGVSITTADEKIFHSMASQKVKGSKLAIKLINKRDKASSFCNDVIGDICGVISGSCGLSIALKMANILAVDSFYLILISTGIISALTIGGKAIGKGFAVNKSNDILFEISKILSIFSKK